MSSGNINRLVDGRLDTYWQGSPGKNVLEISFDGDQVFDRLLLQENITEGQRIEQFVLECLVGDSWIPVTEGTTIGYKRILRFDLVRCSKARIVVRESRDVPQISEIGFYKASGEEAMTE